MPCECEGTNQCDMSKVKDHQQLSVNHHMVQERHGTDSPSQSSAGANTANTWILDF